MSDQLVENESNMEVNNENEQPEFTKPNLTASEIEKAEEAKLKAKYSFKSGPPISGHSTFLQKKLAKGQKFFDSGDYQMAKQNNPSILAGGPFKQQLQQQQMANSGSKLVPSTLSFGTGGAIPTPETVPARKTSIIQSKFPPMSTPLHTIPSTPTSNVTPSFVPTTATSATSENSS